MCIIVSIRVTTTVSSMSYLFKMAYTPSQEMFICKSSFGYLPCTVLRLLVFNHNELLVHNMHTNRFKYISSLHVSPLRLFPSFLDVSTCVSSFKPSTDTIPYPLFSRDTLSTISHQSILHHSKVMTWTWGLGTYIDQPLDPLFNHGHGGDKAFCQLVRYL